MVYYFSRRAFVKATSGLLVGATAIGNIPLINPLRVAHAQATPAMWMSCILDNIQLSRLTIPGTHESCALGPGGPLTQCQSWPLQQQLTSGIRFLDIRCRQTGNVFAIHHSSVFQNMMFGDVLNACTSFLQANPTECIVMSVKNEYTALNPIGTFVDTFNSYVQQTGTNLWYLGEGVPTLGQVRGKIVFFSRAALFTFGLGPPLWPDNTTFTGQWGGVVYQIQDNYKVPTILSADIGNKWGEINNLLNQAAADTSDAWYINFTSGGSSGAYPNAVAANIHPTLYGGLGTYFSKVEGGETFPNRLGTLMLNFPDPYLINRIITLNWIKGFPNP